MNKQYKLHNTSALYFVLGAGFTTSDVAKASVVDDAKVECLKGLGFSFTAVEQPKSYGVVYIRQGDGAKLLAGLGKSTPSAGAGQLDPSKRRFATRDEAIQHGSRFDQRRKDRGDKPGSAMHEGFFLVETFDPVNAAINWKSGLTNSIKA